MPANSTGFDDTLARGSADVKERFSGAASQVKNTISDLGERAANAIDRNRESAAKGLDRAATAIHENAERVPGGERAADLAHTTAERLNSTADYMRDNNVNRMVKDVESLVKSNPGPALITAAAIGFLVGRAFYSRD